MPGQNQRLVLTLNAGSSSVKFSVYRLGAGEELLLSGLLDRIGLADGHFKADDQAGVRLVAETLELPDHESALVRLFDWLRGQMPDMPLAGIGHRVVQGGPKMTAPQLLTAEAIARLRELIPLAPNHLPAEVRAIEVVARAFPGLPQVACFDTAFHRAMPEVSRRYALPRELFDQGVEKYGFHGLSYQYIVEELQRQGVPGANGRMIVAHLGNGASLAAIRGGKPIDTTMGLTPLGGLVMGTRCGDLDPGVVLYLLRERQMSVQEADDLLNKRSGLLGLSGRSSDMKDLLDAEASDPRAAEAIAGFLHQGRKCLAGMAASLGGLDLLVFTAGMGERSAPVRARLCAGLEFLGIRLDEARNVAGESVISADGSPVFVRVMKTNEELMIARQTFAAIESARA